MFFSKKEPINKYTWSQLATPDNVDKIIQKSQDKPVVIFKHSGRCNISAVALNRFEDYVRDIEQLAYVFMIDVVNNRPASLHAAEVLGVVHQSPQVLVIHAGKSVFDDSHNSINGREVLKILNEIVAA